MEENTQRSRRGSVNRTEAKEAPYTQFQKVEYMPNSTHSLSGKSSNLTDKEKENAILAANILTSTVSTLIKAGYVRAAKNQNGEIVLIFPQDKWTPSLRLKWLD